MMTMWLMRNTKRSHNSEEFRGSGSPMEGNVESLNDLSRGKEVTAVGNLKYYLPGSILILIALLIVAVPEILIALAAASMIMLGICGLYIGHLARKSEKEWDMFNGRFFGDDLPGGVC
jgi:VIT1/CCC1 family predicted Fe2+/Mn2+ transporter